MLKCLEYKAFCVCMHGHVEGHVLAILIVRRQGVSLGRFNSMFMSIQSLIVQKKASGREVLTGSPV